VDPSTRASECDVDCGENAAGGYMLEVERAELSSGEGIEWAELVGIEMA
jgi:hypothetical protein